MDNYTARTETAICDVHFTSTLMIDTIDVFYDVIKYDDDDVYFDAQRSAARPTHLHWTSCQACETLARDPIVHLTGARRY